MKKLLIFSIGSFVLAVATIFLMPFGSFEMGGTQKVLAYILAFTFWASFITGTVLLIRFLKARKKINARLSRVK